MTSTLNPQDLTPGERVRVEFEGEWQRPLPSLPSEIFVISGAGAGRYVVALPLAHATITRLPPEIEVGDEVSFSRAGKDLRARVRVVVDEAAVFVEGIGLFVKLLSDLTLPRPTDGADHDRQG